MWRLVLVVVCIMASTVPAWAQEEEPVADCALAYLESFTEWQAYIAGGRQGPQPERPDRSDPCFTERLQGQADAFSAEPQPRPESNPTPGFLPPTPSPTMAPALTATPTPTPGLTIPTISNQTARLSALQGIEDTSRITPALACTALTRLGAAPMMAVEVDGDWVSVLAFVRNLGSRADTASGEFRLRDSRSRQFDMASALEFPGYTTLARGLQQSDLMRAAGVDVVTPTTRIQPGRDAVVLMVFRVAPDADGLSLVSGRSC